ncbi:MAG: T9SS type A sorting domain-containing protein, partial [Bacteroidales bacterium]|nr:T9SS type A sorting domain-containing protein [Bacteroidales bacterium]
NPLTVEGGTFVTFSWKTGGDATVYLNDERVDANASAKFLMTEDCEYTLKVVDNQNPENVEQSKISFHVIPPKPRINLNSVSGILANPGDEMEIETNATAPGGFEVTKVELFLGDEQIATLTEIPFTYKWTAAENLGEYKFSGIVYNNNDDFAKSDTLTLIVTDQKKVRFEAEKAILVDSDAGGSAATNDETCSGGKYMALHDFVTLTFKNIYAPEAGEYPIYIKYMCNFEAPKRQSISVNGVSYGEIEFTSETWDIYKMTLPLDKGMNTITIGASWKWMSFDYIDILGVEERALGELSADLGNFASPNETFKINVNATVPEGKTLEKIELYCVGEDASIAEFTELSSVYAWQVPATEGEYTFFARVYVDGEYTQSDNFTVIVTNLSKARFEAEDAVLVGSGGVVNDKNCSNGKYLDVTEFETVTFNGIVAPKDGTYEIFIGYMCNYQAPKGQDLIVNGKQVEGMMFESTVWSVYTTKVPLKEGENTIQIKASWKWMSFDYIDILGVTKKETVAVPSIENASSSMTAFGNEYSSITVKYDTEARLVSFDVFDMNGHSVAKASTAGENGEFAFNQSLRAGVYVVKMTAGKDMIVKQVVVK